jgi:predicted AAA+ superfamily ATPase
MLKERYLTTYILEDLAEKMVFVGGARQVGKTTLAKDIVASHFSAPSYFNWDRRNDRRMIMRSDWPGNADLIILDEIHKYKKWKSFVKGEYDTLKDRFKFMITGSARLDLYRKGGDSMQGRYHYYRLHPFSMAELTGSRRVPAVFEELPSSSKNENDTLLSLDRFGGFPEHLIKHNEWE